MKIFIDSADLQEIRQAAAMGFLDGCTTNPSLLAKSGRKLDTLLPEICDVVAGPVSAEVVATEYEAILGEGRTLAKMHPNVVVKVPLIVDGLRACRTLTAEGIRCNVTLCFSPTQALLAAKAGAAYVSPFLGRVDDTAYEGTELLQQIVTIYRNYGFKTQVLAASMRSPLHVARAALIGADCATIPMGVLTQLIRHPLADVGLDKFLSDAKRASNKAV